MRFQLVPKESTSDDLELL